MSEIVSEATWKSYVHDMYPVQSLEGEDLELLRQELDADFYIDPENPNDDDNDDDPRNFVPDNVLKFAKRVNGMKWINALHSFNDECQHTPLTWVLQHESDNWRTTQLLVQYGADVNIRDGKGRPPLYHAIRGIAPRWRVVDILLEAGANAMAYYKGQTLAEIIRQDAEEEQKYYHDHQRPGHMPGPHGMIWESVREKYKLH